MSCSSDKPFHGKNNCILIIEAMFIHSPESVVVPPVRPFDVYIYNLKVSSR